DPLQTLKNGKSGQLIDIVGGGFILTPGRTVQVLFSGPTQGFGSIDLTDPRNAPTSTTLVVTGTPAARNLNPGNYTLIVTNFDGQSARVPGTLVVQ
ncbi:MAG: hypothetical protein ACJ79R_01175, partial [Anaeromyxobacteraceae bacterium]